MNEKVSTFYIKTLKENKNLFEFPNFYNLIVSICCSFSPCVSVTADSAQLANPRVTA